MTNIIKFRHAPMFEERLCTSCQRMGDPDPYWPADSEFWPRIHGLLDFHRCKACLAASVARSKMNRRAA